MVTRLGGASDNAMVAAPVMSTSRTEGAHSSAKSRQLACCLSTCQLAGLSDVSAAFVAFENMRAGTGNESDSGSDSDSDSDSDSGSASVSENESRPLTFGHEFALDWHVGLGHAHSKKFSCAVWPFKPRF